MKKTRKQVYFNNFILSRYAMRGQPDDKNAQNGTRYRYFNMDIGDTVAVSQETNPGQNACQVYKRRPV